MGLLGKGDLIQFWFLNSSVFLSEANGENDTSTSNGHDDDDAMVFTCCGHWASEGSSS